MNETRWQANFTDYHSPPWHMDIRHARMLKAVILGQAPRSIVEIGSYRGASTAAIVEAIKEGAPVKEVHCVDESITPELRMVAAGVACFNFHEMSSRHFVGSADFWLIDGAHDWSSALTDLATATRSGTHAVIAVHDSHNHAPQHEGAVEIARLVARDARHVWQDARPRPGELTQRGIVFGFFGSDPQPATLAALDALAL